MTALMTRAAYERHVERSLTLFQAGYRIRCCALGIFTVVSPAGKEYEVDAERGGCSCPSGIRPCKHEKGLPQLICDTLDDKDLTIRSMRFAMSALTATGKGAGE